MTVRKYLAKSTGKGSILLSVVSLGLMLPIQMAYAKKDKLPPRATPYLSPADPGAPPPPSDFRAGRLPPEAWGPDAAPLAPPPPPPPSRAAFVPVAPTVEHEYPPTPVRSRTAGRPRPDLVPAVRDSWVFPSAEVPPGREDGAESPPLPPPPPRTVGRGAASRTPVTLPRTEEDIGMGAYDRSREASSGGSAGCTDERRSSTATVSILSGQLTAIAGHIERGAGTRIAEDLERDDPLPDVKPGESVAGVMLPSHPFTTDAAGDDAVEAEGLPLFSPLAAAGSGAIHRNIIEEAHYLGMWQGEWEAVQKEVREADERIARTRKGIAEQEKSDKDLDKKTLLSGIKRGILALPIVGISALPAARRQAIMEARQESLRKQMEVKARKAQRLTEIKEEIARLKAHLQGRLADFPLSKEDNLKHQADGKAKRLEVIAREIAASNLRHAAGKAERQKKIDAEIERRVKEIKAAARSRPAASPD